MPLSETGTLFIDTPPWAEPFLQPARYKAAYGGRGSGKSHFFAEAAIERCVIAPTRVVCIREIQRTIRDSVRQLLVDKIHHHGVLDEFEILRDEIRGANGSLIIFRGMQDFNADNIKSLEDFDIAWVEEAQTLTERSLRLLRPTLRKDGSELWFGWNPRHDTDAVDKFFRGGHPPEEAVIREVNWRDNPWFPAVLVKEKNEDFERDPDMANHVWEGGYEVFSEASYYGRWIASAEKEGRIGVYPYDPMKPVHTSWDIGVDDYTAIWFWQEDGVTATVIDFFEAQNEGAEQIVNTALPEYHESKAEGLVQRIKLGRSQPWRYGNHYLPHDIKVREWGAGARSRVQTLLGLGLRNIVPGAAQAPDDRVDAARKLLPFVQFNDTPSVRVGISHLRRYSRKLNKEMGLYTGPLHDEHSHAADAFGEFAINGPLKPAPPPAPEEPKQMPGQVYLPGPPKPRRPGQRRQLV